MTTVKDRVRAARGQAGYKRREDFCAELNLPRFGKQVLGQVERGERVLYPHEAEDLGRVLGVEPDWLLHGSAQPVGLAEINAKLDLILDYLGVGAEESATSPTRTEPTTRTLRPVLDRRTAG